MESNTLEKIILSAMLTQRDFSRKVLPYAQPIFFSTTEAATLTDIIKKYNEDYKGIPTKEQIEVELENKKGVSTDVYTNTKTLISQLYRDNIVESVKSLDADWLLDRTEAHFKQQSCHIAVLNSISILEGEDKKNTPESIPKILEEALSISFDTDVGHDYIEDAEERFEYYHSSDIKIPFHLNALNKVTNGGAVKKAMIVPVAPTGVGKSFFMTAWSAWLIRQGYNVLYVTLEMAEEKIAERVDACLMDITLNDLSTCPKETFLSKIKKLQTDTLGTLKIKEYPSNNFTAQTLRMLMDELKRKQGFTPDVIMIDYLNLVTSYRVAKSNDTYTSVKFAAEELRSIAMEMNTLIVAPTQTNREGVGAADYTLTEISESMGIAHTSDFIFGLIETEELRNNSQLRVKLLKNRWGSLSPSSFVITAIKSKMQMFDMDDLDSMQVDIPSVAPVVSDGMANLRGLLGSKPSKPTLKF